MPDAEDTEPESEPDWGDAADYWRGVQEDLDAAFGQLGER